jgi:hypothetical protein
MFLKSSRWLVALVLCCLAIGLQARPLAAQAPRKALGIFEGQTDVGSVTPAGTAAFDAKSGVYTVKAAGANLWSTEDGFHFAWKKLDSAMFSHSLMRHSPSWKC